MVNLFIIVLALITQLSGLSGHCTSSLGPISQYCQKIKSSFIPLSKSIPDLHNSVTIDFCIDNQGQINNVQISRDSKASEASKKTALELVKNLKKIAAPPSSMKCPVWLTADIDEQKEKTSVWLRDINWSAYMDAVQKRVKQFWVYPPKSNTSRSMVVAFKIWRNGSVSDLKVARSSGWQAFDNSGLQAVRQASPFWSLYDGSPDYVNIEFSLDYNVHPKSSLYSRSNKKMMRIPNILSPL